MLGLLDTAELVRHEWARGGCIIRCIEGEEPAGEVER